MKKLINFLLALLLINVSVVFGQIDADPAQFEVQLTLNDNLGGSNPITFGLDPLALPGLDQFEDELSPPPPVGVWEARFINEPGQSSLGQGSFKDIRTATGGFPFTGSYTHRVKVQVTENATQFTITWGPLPAGIVAPSRIVDLFGGLAGLNVPLDPAGGSLVVTNLGFSEFKLELTYSNVGPASPGPNFGVAPASLNFGNVGIGSSSTQTLTVSNSGTNFSTDVNSASILGLSPEFVVVPNPPTGFPITIAPGGSYNFDVTFTPNSPTTFSDNVRFTHTGTNVASPFDVAITGTGQSQGGTLVFDPQTRTVFDNYQGYSTDIILDGYVGNPLKALQFKVVLDGKLIFRSIERGAAIANGVNWTFAYEIAPGPVNSDGSRNDTIKVVVVGNGLNQLAAGDHEIAVLEYDVVNLQVNQTTTTVSFEEVIGGTGEPTPGADANIVAGPDQQITINNRVFYGDVNIDDRVDILDILLMIDYILDRVTFTTEQFTRGDIAPWLSGSTPSPDGQINAFDLALLQNIVLTGEYPSGEPAQGPVKVPDVINGLAKLNPGDDAALTFHITEEGIAVILESIVKTKGLQVEFSQIASSTSGMQVQTFMGNGYHNQIEDLLRVLVYDDQGLTLEPGEYLYLNLPFEITNPRDIKIENIVLANEESGKIEKLGINVIYGNAPQLPVEYALSQNYPNPFNPTTEVQFTVPQTSDVTIVVFDMLGQEVRTLYAGQVDRGTYSVQWDGLNNSGSKMSSGSYVYRMIAGDFVQSKKMILMK